MAKVKQYGAGRVGLSMIDVATQVMSENQAMISTGTAIKNVVGVESFTSPAASAARQRDEETLSASLRNGLTRANIAIESLTDAQIAAGTMVLMAQGDRQGYAAAAMSDSFVALESGQVEANMTVAGVHGSLDLGAPALGLEYYSDQTLDKYMGASFRFNVAASRQDNFAETIMPTIVADPTEAGLMLEVKKLMTHRAVKHALKDKDSVGYARRNILDGATDASLLDDESIKFVPYVLQDGSNAKYFISDTLYTPVQTKVGDYTVPTAPLAFGPGKKNLLSLSAHPGLVTSGVLDESDELSGRIELSSVLMTIGKKGGDPADVQLVRIKTANLARSTFNKSQEGDGMELELSFRDAIFSLSEATRDEAGAPVVALDALVNAKYRMNYTLEVRNAVNIQTGMETNLVSAPEVLGLMNEDGEGIDHTVGAGKMIVDDIEIIPVGYVYATTRANTNRRSKGILIDTTVERERYKIQLGSPITSRKPVGRADLNEAVEDLITVSRIRTSNMMVTKVLNSTEVVAEYQRTVGKDNEYQVPSIEGIGRHYVRPWHEETTLKMADMVSSLDDVSAVANIRAKILNTLRDQLVRGIRASRFQPALEMISGYTMTRPKVIVGTDIIIANWLDVPGDKRSLGDFEYEIVTTTDSRWDGRIQWFLKASDGKDGLNPLNYGNHLWIPELVTDTNLTRNEGVSNEITVQPRNTHIVNCNVTAVTLIEGIPEFLKARPSLSVVTSAPIGGSTDPVVVGPIVP